MVPVYTSPVVPRATAESRPVYTASGSVVLEGMAIGLALFLVHNLALWSAWAGAPSGFRPLFHLRTNDASQYLGFLALARDHNLFSDLHAPWMTEPAMLNPIFLIGGRAGAWLGMSPLAVLNTLQFLSFLVAGLALAWVLRVFLATRAQRVATVIVGLCAVPLMMLALGVVRFLAPGAAPLFWLGTIELSYMSADGLLRGGLSNSPTLTLGAASTLLALGLTAMRLQTGRRVFTLGLGLVVLVSSAIHPFEVFVIAPGAAAGLLFLARRAWAEAALVALASAAGLAPHIFLSLHHTWLRELNQTFTFDASFARIILTYGLPFLALPYLLLMGARPKELTDKLLLLWWLLTVTISLLPGAPFPPHLLNGFALVTALLVVRLATNPKFRQIYQAHRRGLALALGCLLLLTGAAYAGMYTQIARDARSATPALLLSAVAADDQIAVVEELRQRGGVDDLALAPDPVSMMVTEIPMHSFASHEHLSFDYRGQQAQATQFFEGRMSRETAFGFLSGYGVRWIVLAEGSPARAYFDGRTAAFERGRYRVYELPGNHMQAYPGIANILPPSERLEPLMERILRALNR